MTTSNTMTIADLLAAVTALPAGAVARRTAGGFRTAILALRRTLELGDDTDLAGVDVEELFDEFRGASPDWWTPNTITTYCNNLRRVLTGFNGGGEWVGARRSLNRLSTGRRIVLHRPRPTPPARPASIAEPLRMVQDTAGTTVAAFPAISRGPR